MLPGNDGLTVPGDQIDAICPVVVRGEMNGLPPASIWTSRASGATHAVHCAIVSRDGCFGKSTQGTRWLSKLSVQVIVVKPGIGKAEGIWFCRTDFKW